MLLERGEATPSSMNSYQSPWFRRDDLDAFLQIVKIGDLLEVDRENYSHWGVYVGCEGPSYEPSVVHNCLINQNGPSSILTSSCCSEVKSFESTHNTQSDKKENDEKENSSSIRLEHLKDVLENDKVRINNNKDQIWSPFSPEEVKQRALEKLLDGSIQYCTFRYNCEHFANECRYGRQVSVQLVAVASLAVVSVYLFGPIVTAAMVANVMFNYRRRNS